VSVFVDTSALLAVLHAGDENHPRAARTFRELIESKQDLVTTSYVLVEPLRPALPGSGVPRRLIPRVDHGGSSAAFPREPSASFPPASFLDRLGT
jgi:hypothetical protein